MTAQQKRRKKTRDQKRVANVQKMQGQIKKTDQKDKMSWNKLIEIFQQCLDMYLPIHAITPVLASASFKERATQEDCKRIMDQVKQLTGHVEATLGDLHDIRRKHFGRTGDVRGEKRTMEAIQIGMDYQNWIVKFNETVVVLSLEISGMIEDIMADKKEPGEQPVSNEPLFEDIDVTDTEGSDQPATPTEDKNHVK